MQRDLVIRARAGDVEAFSALTVDKVARLTGAARLIVRRDDIAADAVQDALLLAWVDLPGLRDPDRFDAWLHRLLVRACYRAAKHVRLRDVTEIVMGGGPEPGLPDHQSTVATRDQLDRGFARLSKDHRAAIVLHHYLGLSLAEAADALGIPLGTMQSRMNRATRIMRAALDADERTVKSAREFVR
jgi:RNA polymerase sigma-70 factor (ECF subfamily)